MKHSQPELFNAVRDLAKCMDKVYMTQYMALIPANCLNKEVLLPDETIRKSKLTIENNLL